MIIQAEMIAQPCSGAYPERIYDNESAWNSEYWAFIKFTNDDYTEWCGKFRGFPVQVAISTKYRSVLVLTSDYLFQLDINTANLTDIEDRPQYHNLTVAPNGDFILADYYNFDKITTSIKDKEPIDSPIRMDTIAFKKWEKEKLEFTCDEFFNWDRHLSMIYDSGTNKIEIVNG